MVCVKELEDRRWSNVGQQESVCGVSMYGLWKGHGVTLNPVKMSLLPAMRVTMLQ
jgi:hypothetical protein